MQNYNTDTHDLAVQASAFSWIELLKKRYPEMVSFNISGSDAADKTVSKSLSTCAQSQGSLLAYLDELINPEKTEALLSSEDKAAAKANPAIAGVIEVTTHIQALNESLLTPEDKKRVFQQMQYIATLYPGAIWDENTEQWSFNTRYNANRQSNETLMTPPAEALNLVCAGLLDKTHNRTTPGEEGADFGRRIETFYTNMLELRNDADAKQRQKCSAGLQHDVLHLLHGSYLDDSGELMPWVTDTVTFLKFSLSEFVAAAVQKAPQVEANNMVLAWMHWHNATTSEPCPLRDWLRTQYPSSGHADKGWQAASIAYIEQRCHAIGVNLSRPKIQEECIDCLDYLPIPALHPTITPLIDALMRMKPLTGGGASKLFDLSGEALLRFKASITPEQLTEPQAQSIQDLFSALTATESLHRYRDMTLLLGAEDARFEKTRHQLQDILITYFSDYRIEKRLHAGFQRARQHYAEQEQEFLNHHPADWIANFFALLKDTAPSVWNAAWARLRALQSAGVSQHPLLLSDEALLRLRQQSETTLEDGSTVIDITPYAINRILIQGFLVPPAQWTPLYGQYLSIITFWLLEPVSPGLTREFKASYPKGMLTDLLFISLIQQGIVEPDLRARVFEWRKNSQVHNSAQWPRIFANLQLTTEEIAQILNAIQGQLGILIKDEYGLRHLFSLSIEQLSQEQRTQILNAIQGQLGILIKDGYGLHHLFILSIEQLSQQQRTQIWSAVQGQLGNMIKDGGQLSNLFTLALNSSLQSSVRRC